MTRLASITGVLLYGLAACGHGETPPGDAPSSIDTQPFLASVCTSGEPDQPGAPNPNCLVNAIPLEVAGSSLEFVLQSNPQLWVEGLELRAGSAGLRMRHPQVLTFAGADDPAPQVIDAYPDTLIELPPGASILIPDVPPPGDASLSTLMGFRFDELAPTR